MLQGDVLLAHPGGEVERLYGEVERLHGEVERLRRSEARWEAALEHLAEGVVIATDTGQLIYRNPAAVTMYDDLPRTSAGAPTEETPGGIERWTVDGDRPLTADEWPVSRMLRGEVIRDFEVRMRPPDHSSERILSISGAILKTAVGERLLRVSIVDRTEQRKAEADTRQNARQFQEIIDASPGMIFIKDLDGRHLACNQAFARFVSRSREDVIGKTDYDLFERHQADLFRDNDRKTIDTATALQTEEPVGQRCYLADKFPLRDARGNIYALGGIAIDITDRKQSDVRLREIQKLESVGALVGGVAHTFNNVLTGTVVSANLIQEMLDANHPASALATGIVEMGQRLAHLTNQLLAYAGQGRFVLEPVDLAALVHEMRELLEASVPRAVTFHFDLTPDLPSMEAERGQIQQILMNLVTNAVEAIGNDDGRIVVRTLLRAVDTRYTRTHPSAAHLTPGDYVVLEVRDTGCGIDTFTKAKMFEPFFTTKLPGRGLGLAAVAGIVRAHKGGVVVTSHPGKGTVFHVLLPAIPRPGTVRPHAAADLTDEKRLGVVLVVDDELPVRRLLRMALERQGYQVLEAEDGLSALDIVKQYPGKIDLAILDLRMPGMSGEETLRELRKMGSGMRVLLSSGFTEGQPLTVFDGEHSGFLQKPYTIAKLAEMVKSALS